MFTGGLLEFFLGNTFPFVVFTCFGKFPKMLYRLRGFFADNTFRWILVRLWYARRPQFYKSMNIC